MSHPDSRTDCPARETLAAYNAGRLSGPVLDEVAGHISQCALCESTLQELNRQAETLAMPASPSLAAADDVRETTMPLPQPPVPDGNAPQDNSADAVAEAATETAQPPGGADARQKPPVPQHIGRYRVESLLGAGTFAYVYLAYDDDLGRAVAVKVPRPERFATEAQIAQFVAEARTTARLQHRHIVGVYDVGRTGDGFYFVVLQYIDGCTLGDYWKTAPRPHAETARLIAQAAEAVHYAHKQGFVHRDLKPSNVLVDAAGQPFVVDFGLALHEDMQRRRAGEVSGTPAYMSPEQIHGDAHRLDGRSDVWSLGVMRYEGLTGRKPFAGARSAEVMDEILHRNPKPPRQIDDRIPPGLEQVCLKCLAKTPTDRYTTAADLAADLRRFATDADDSTSPAAGPSQADSPAFPAFLRGKAGWAAAALAVVMLLVLWAGSAGWLNRQTGADGTLGGNGASGPVSPAGDPEGTPAAPLSGTVTVRIWDPNDPLRRGLSLADPRALPVGNGDQVRIEADVSRPGFVYIVWIDAEGHTSPVYPWEPGDWRTRPVSENRVTTIRLPEQADGGWRMGGPAGMETIVLLAREQSPLPAEVDLEQLLADFPVQSSQNPQALVWWEDGQISRDVERAPQFYSPEKIDDPVLTAQRLLAERLRPHFDLIRAVSFANRGGPENAGIRGQVSQIRVE